MTFYMLADGKLHKIYKRRKPNLSYFGTHAPKIVKFTRKKGLLFSRKADLKQVFDYYTTLGEEEK